MAPRFFRTPQEFRKWLRQHHASATELLVGFHRKDSGTPSLTWPESVDEALCFGWIDGVRRRLDEASYTIRFTPRRARSTWSAVNIRRVRELAAAQRMAPAGLEAFASRTADNSGQYSYEQRPDELIEPYARLLRGNPPAHRFFSHQAPSYRRAAIWWVISAKKEATRLKRTATLIELSAGGKQVPQFLPRQASPGRA